MIIIDVEATGPNPRRNSIASIGAVDFSDSENQFYGECRIWEESQIDPIALKVNGFTEDQLKDPKKDSEAGMLKKFSEWMKQFPNKSLAGQHPSFDRDFINAASRRAGLGMLIWRKTIDLHAICYAHMLGRRLEIPLSDERSDLTTDMIFNYVGLPKEPRPHNGLTGAKMEAEAFSRLIHGKTFLKEFESHDVPRYLL